MSKQATAIIPKVENMMVQRLTAPMVQERRDIISGLLKMAYGDTFSDTIAASTITDMLAGRVQAWEILGKVDGTVSFMGMFTTSIAVTRRYPGRKSLYVEALAANSRLAPAAWAEGMRALEVYAKKNGCAIIEADVMNEKVARQAERLGFRKTCVRILKEV